MSTIGIPIKVLHEAEGHVITVEMKSGELFRGRLAEAEDSMNMHLQVSYCFYEILVFLCTWLFFICVFPRGLYSWTSGVCLSTFFHFPFIPLSLFCFPISLYAYLGSCAYDCNHSFHSSCVVRYVHSSQWTSIRHGHRLHSWLQSSFYDSSGYAEECAHVPQPRQDGRRHTTARKRRRQSTWKSSSWCVDGRCCWWCYWWWWWWRYCWCWWCWWCWWWWWLRIGWLFDFVAWWLLMACSILCWSYFVFCFLMIDDWPLMSA